MTYHFTRPDFNLSAWSKTTELLHKNLDETITGECTEAEVRDFCLRAARDAKPPKGKPSMLFWGYAEPDTMPGDARCDFFYLPTYLVLLTMVAGINHHPGVMADAAIRETIGRGLKACMGCGLAGHGYDAEEVQVENLQLFSRAGIRKFLLANPDLCPEFGEMLHEIVARYQQDLKDGRCVGVWGNDYSAQVKKALEAWENSMGGASAN